jgi:biopolymer transport protein ExbB/TolQ
MQLIETLMKVALLGASWVLYLLIGLSIISIAVMAERFWFFRKNTDRDKDLGDEIVPFLEANDVAGAQKKLKTRGSIAAGVIAMTLEVIDGGTLAVRSLVDSELAKRRKDMERGLNFLGTLGSNAPFIGLFGTVIGVIEAFHYLGSGNDDEAMMNVMAGIAEALVATGVGLFVAIPAVVAYNLLQAKVATVENAVDAVTKQLCAHIEGRPSRLERESRSRLADTQQQRVGEDTPPTGAALSAELLALADDEGEAKTESKPESKTESKLESKPESKLEVDAEEGRDGR